MAIEFWSTVAEVEMDMIAEAEEGSEEAKPMNFILAAVGVCPSLH